MTEIDRAFLPIARLLAQVEPPPHDLRLERVPVEKPSILDRRYPIATHGELTGLRLDNLARSRLLDDWSEKQEWENDHERDEDLIEWYYWRYEFPDLVRDASAFYVTPELCHVIHHAANSLPETYILISEHVPTQFGLVVLGSPLTWDGDPPDDPTLIDLIYWHLLPHGVILMFCDTTDRSPVGYPWGCAKWFTNPLFGHSQHSDDPEYGDGDRMWLYAFWLLIAQNLPATERRQARRQLRRHDLADAPTLHTTTYCTLRRRESSSGEPQPTDVEWTHRWLVSGHWREQYYPSTDEHKTIWIGPYVKGPDHLPLIPKDRAFVVSR